MSLIVYGIGFVVLAIAAGGFKVVRPMERGIVETFGKYSRIAQPGLNYIIPIVQRAYKVDMTERMVDADPQEIITKDKLNATVDAQVYFKVKNTEADIKASQYNVQNYAWQIVQLARTTLRNIIGTMTLNEANSERDKINTTLMTTLEAETKNWGIEVVRTELKEINPPKVVQETMNKVVIAENEKQAALDFATATETKADGERRAAIKEAEGIAKGKIIVAEAEAQKIKLVNEAAEKYFVGNAQLLKKLEVTEASLKDNSKIILTEKGIQPQLLIGDLPVKGK